LSRPATEVLNGFFNRKTAKARNGLNEAGFIEGKNVAVDYRWAEDRYDRPPALAVELVRRRVAVIIASGAVTGPLAVPGGVSDFHSYAPSVDELAHHAQDGNM
jgi:hypothetical protein